MVGQFSQVSPKLATESRELDECASMMISTPPWRELNFTYEQCRTTLEPGNGLDTYALSDANGITGFVAALALGVAMEPMLEFLCVRDDLRNHGIGMSLVKFFEEQLFPDAKNLFILVSDINPKAEALYRRLGYDRVGAFDNYNLPGQVEYLLRKSRGPRQL
jgi:ribosomal protein S18 acetylase RimI-like enzyme